MIINSCIILFIYLFVEMCDFCAIDNCICFFFYLLILNVSSPFYRIIYFSTQSKSMFIVRKLGFLCFSFLNCSNNSRRQINIYIVLIYYQVVDILEKKSYLYMLFEFYRQYNAHIF